MQNINKKFRYVAFFKKIVLRVEIYTKYLWICNNKQIKNENELQVEWKCKNVLQVICNRGENLLQVLCNTGNELHMKI